MILRVYSPASRPRLRFYRRSPGFFYAPPAAKFRATERVSVRRNRRRAWRTAASRRRRRLANGSL